MKWKIVPDPLSIVHICPAHHHMVITQEATYLLLAQIPLAQVTIINHLTRRLGILRTSTTLSTSLPIETSEIKTYGSGIPPHVLSLKLIGGRVSMKDNGAVAATRVKIQVVCLSWTLVVTGGTVSED
jgi:hypothetical protein